MTAIGWAVSVILMIGYLTVVIWSVVLSMGILTQVNSRLPQDKQFPFLP
jgi:hypothetical protein